MNYPIPNIELQTTGVMLYKKDNIYLLNRLGVNTISISVSDIFSDERNMEIEGVPEKLKFKLNELITFLKGFDFNIRLSLNMTTYYFFKGI